MPAIDGLRAVAVALVVAIHIFPTVLFPGEVGVDVFFVISGFLITLILLRQQEQGSFRFGRFYVNRALRLYPPLVVVVIATVLFGLLPGGSVREAAVNGALSLLYLGNITMTLSGTWLGDLSHTWSLAMEEQFYLVWPLVLVLLVGAHLTRRGIAYVLAAAAIASAIGWIFTGEQLPFNPLTRCLGLIVGCILALVTASVRKSSGALAGLGALGFGAVLVLGSLGAINHMWTTLFAVVTIPFVILHLAFGRGPAVQILSWGPIVYLGVISYEIYLWHYPLMAALRRTTDWDDWMIGVVAVPVTLVLSWATHRFISAPVLARRDAYRARKLAASRG